MKRIASLVMVVFMMSVSIPALAAEMTQEQKNECLLASKRCLNEVDTLQQKIKKLDAEIKKGKRVYTPEELKKLNEKLKEAESMADQMLMGGQ